MVLAVNPITQRLFCSTSSQDATSLSIHLSWWINKTQRDPHFPEVPFEVTNGYDQLQVYQMVIHRDIHPWLIISRYPDALHRPATVSRSNLEQLHVDSPFVEKCGQAQLYPTGCCKCFTHHSNGKHPKSSALHLYPWLTGSNSLQVRVNRFIFQGLYYIS